MPTLRRHPRRPPYTRHRSSGPGVVSGRLGSALAHRTGVRDSPVAGLAHCIESTSMMLDRTRRTCSRTVNKDRRRCPMCPARRNARRMDGCRFTCSAHGGWADTLRDPTKHTRPEIVPMRKTESSSTAAGARGTRSSLWFGCPRCGFAAPSDSEAMVGPLRTLADQYRAVLDLPTSERVDGTPKRSAQAGGRTSTIWCTYATA